MTVSRKLYTKELGRKVAVSARPVKSRKFHVIVGDDRHWAVVADGNSRPTRVFASQLSAIDFAKESASRINGEVIIHKTSGEVEKRVSLAK